MSDRIYLALDRETTELALADWPQRTAAQAAIVMALRAALASKESPERCGGTGELFGDITDSPSSAVLPRIPCPDCQPESVEGEDWPELTIKRPKDGFPLLRPHGKLPTGSRRYIPAGDNDG